MTTFTDAGTFPNMLGHLTAFLFAFCALIGGAWAIDAWVIPKIRGFIRRDKAPPRPEKRHQFALNSAHEKDYDLVYEPKKAIDFYDAIAERYDARQSDNVIKTHYEVIEAIRKLLDSTHHFNILDLGGGTAEIAEHLGTRDNLTWYYVDASSKMADRATFNLRCAHMEKKFATATVETQLDVLIKGEVHFTAIIMSWLLSSLSNDISFRKLAKLLESNGQLIVTDGHPENLDRFPLYGIDIGGKKVALRLRKILPERVITTARRAGLGLQGDTKTIFKPDGLPYGFLQVYGAVYPHDLEA